MLCINSDNQLIVARFDLKRCADKVEFIMNKFSTCLVVDIDETLGDGIVGGIKYEYQTWLLAAIARGDIDRDVLEIESEYKFLQCKSRIGKQIY
jgi:hypothetical protein